MLIGLPWLEPEIGASEPPDPDPAPTFGCGFVRRATSWVGLAEPVEASSGANMPASASPAMPARL